MNTDPPPPSPVPPADGTMSPEQFREWLKMPGNQEKFYQLVAKFNQPLPPDASPEEVAKRAAMAEKTKLVLALAPFKRKLDELRAVMQRPPRHHAGGNRLAQCRALLDEMSDALLDVPEPHRTHHFKQLLPLREKILGIKVD